MVGEFDTPDWDERQIETIIEPVSSWQIVTAPPGAGKTAVACQRIAYLVDSGVASSAILLISFTRTAVAELRNRIASYSEGRDEIEAVRISTIDSHAWHLRVGFESEPLGVKPGNTSYDLSIRRTVELLQSTEPQLMEFLRSLDHVLIDEAQDVVGDRARLIVALLGNLDSRCGVTVFADPVQSIYGFTTEEGENSTRADYLLDLLETSENFKFKHITIDNVYRTTDAKLLNGFAHLRELAGKRAVTSDHIRLVQDRIQNLSLPLGTIDFGDIAGLVREHWNDSTLVLFRRRGDALVASSYCSNEDLSHRLRLSRTPMVVEPWIGWLLYDFEETKLYQSDFSELWKKKREQAQAPFHGKNVDEAWITLRYLAADETANAINLSDLRRILARARPPVQICYEDFGYRGPILGTIHASKGREADDVLLIMTDGQTDPDFDVVAEEGRVHYVGATRSRHVLASGKTRTIRYRYLDSGRVYRWNGNRSVQVEVGRPGDIDRTGHLKSTDRLEIQEALANSVGQPRKLRAVADPNRNFRWSLTMDIRKDVSVTRELEVGQLSREWENDVSLLWGMIDRNDKLRPAFKLDHIYLFGITTIGLSDSEMENTATPFDETGIALAPAVKGFTPLSFYSRRTRKA